jgi:hypothetical protein
MEGEQNHPNSQKGDKSSIVNYGPISNLCWFSKVFEKLIMLRIQQIQQAHNVYLTGNPQYGFKRSRSALTAGLNIQTIILRALENNEYAICNDIEC